jgi:hypothetical protein
MGQIVFVVEKYNVDSGQPEKISQPNCATGPSMPLSLGDFYHLIL